VYASEDQSRINTFSKLNTRMADIEDELKRVLVRPAPLARSARRLVTWSAETD
jgi:hypothetical protein